MRTTQSIERAIAAGSTVLEVHAEELEPEAAGHQSNDERVEAGTLRTQNRSAQNGNATCDQAVHGLRTQKDRVERMRRKLGQQVKHLRLCP
jgi:hypothetical protein